MKPPFRFCPFQRSNLWWLLMCFMYPASIKRTISLQDGGESSFAKLPREVAPIDSEDNLGFIPIPPFLCLLSLGKKKKRGKDRDILPNKTANSFMGSKNARNLCPRVFLT
ncbi:hypothetical protein CEXT_676071 [Caerostris extrusa]|uniref:Secreted protein n=1 Tax=Caerostris extrusa TaxID=172846 RepID=A0AAV4PRB3_CAEEX|nr:hypothetical protein CEXT_676071 [Caerostris extrusa]